MRGEAAAEHQRHTSTTPTRHTHLCHNAQQRAAARIDRLEPHQLVDKEFVLAARPRLTVTQRQQQQVASEGGGLVRGQGQGCVCWNLCFRAAGPTATRKA
jgi:hypothetical protein